MGAVSKAKTLFAQQDAAQFNWAGNVRYGTNRLLNIESVDQLQEFVKKQNSLKALGSRHCFSRIADNAHQLISLRSMNRMLDIDETEKTVSVEAGITYSKLGPELDRQGYALHNLASLPDISVAGAIATATHGSGSKNGNLASAVAEIELVTADGELRTLSRQKDADEFLGAVVHLGALGIVTRVKLDIQPAFRINEYTYQGLKKNILYEKFSQIMNSAYSVSLFTYRNKDGFANWPWATVRLKVQEEAGFEAKPELFGARLDARRNTTGSWWERLPHFAIGDVAAKGNELQTEYFVAMEHAVDAIKAVATLADRIQPLLHASELRTVAADKLWMSTCYEQQSLAIHFTWKPDQEGVANLLPEIEKRLAPFEARPHWGKLFFMGSKTLEDRYDRLADFRRLVSRYDPEAKFGNAFLRNKLGV
ncbi:MAG: FAD-binding protein [Pseudomonadales bacterium]|nr:FAD-binding protein [Pseudomonadales bacterium]